MGVFELRERPGAFYIGGEFDLERGELTGRPVFYDARDLTTHGLIVGMTGSGKTGLCIDIIEEAALDGVPSIIIDPKGDITNLLLTFPELRPADFRPWVNLDDARRRGMSVDEYASMIAKTWREGLARWGISPERIRRLRESAEFIIFTPGSDAGVPVSVLSSLRAPELDWDEQREAIQEKISGTVSAILALAGVKADPIKSREHILLSLIFEEAWQRGEDLNMESLIKYILKPPFSRVGVFDVDTFYPEKERFSLAMSLNNIVASPSFRSWLVGYPMDVDRLLYSEEGKPRVSIMYIAHLSDKERMFFVTLLLEQVLAWMRTLSGTTSLRAILYFDEVYGFFPPIANPPSKKPLMTLLKQARAFGLGVLLATQNPVDVDYKGLTNIGTWFIGRLQARRDKERLLEGLEQAASEGGRSLEKAEIDRIISSLEGRTFFLHNVHREKPIVFRTRWAMSYLRGPLTRQQIRLLMAPVKERLAAYYVTTGGGEREGASVAVREKEAEKFLPSLPKSKAEVPYFFVPISLTPRDVLADIKSKAGYVEEKGYRLVYTPHILAVVLVRFYDARKGVDRSEEYVLLLPPQDAIVVSMWSKAQRLNISPDRLLAEPELSNAYFSPLHRCMTRKRDFARIKRTLVEYVYRNMRCAVYYNPDLKIYSREGEDLRSFRIRVMQMAREARDAEIQKISEKYQAKIAKLTERLEKAWKQLREKEKKLGELKSSQLASAIGGILSGRSRRAVSSLAKWKRRVEAAEAAVKKARERVEELARQIKKMQAEMNSKINEATRKWQATTDRIEIVYIPPRRSDIVVEELGVAWLPFWYVEWLDRYGYEHCEVYPAFKVG
ncbi:MAG: hypothetical protein DRJ46_00735 [Thermoprotei archaeon]|nr:MAG: hypothetical protein DRJ46_00735 [Thermoprotei archaeon]